MRTAGGGLERGGWALPLFNVDDEAATWLDQHAKRACQAPRRRGSVARLRRRTGRSALCRACDLDPRWPRRRRRQALLKQPPYVAAFPQSDPLATNGYRAVRI